MRNSKFNCIYSLYLQDYKYRLDLKKNIFYSVGYALKDILKRKILNDARFITALLYSAIIK